MLERIMLILKSKNISASKFADEIGAQRSGISHILSGRNNPSLELIQKILKCYPDINAEWLILGQGLMNKTKDLSDDEIKNEVQENTIENQQNIENVPFSKDLIEEEHEDKIEKIPIKKDKISEKNLTKVSLQQQQTIVHSAKQEDKLEEKKIQIIKNKCVEKIIIFNSDNTFSVHTPEKS